MGVSLSSPDLAGAAVIAGTLRQLAQRLAGVDRLTEQAFLRLGESIDCGQKKTAALTHKAAALLTPVDGEDAEQIVMRLQLLTERCDLWLNDAWRQTQEISAILTELDRGVAALQLPREALSKIVKILQSLRVATRIEAARSHGALVLGVELKGISQMMHQKIGEIVERCEVLSALLQRALLIEQQTQEGVLAAARIEVSHARQLLSQVACQCLRTTDRNSLLHRHSTELATNFGELVAALQFQDITRQRLQHITQTLYELSRCQGGDKGRGSGSLYRLQYEQLQWAADEFVAAVHSLASNLQRMAFEIQQLATATGTAIMSGGEEQLCRLAPSLQAVIAFLHEVQVAHLAASQALFAVHRAVGDVTLLTDEIEQLGEEMQLLAQNAAISAAHGAHRGAGLTVIADNIQKLAEDAGRQAQILADRCCQVNARAGELDSLEQNCGGIGNDLDDLLNEAGTLIERLRSAGETAGSRVAALGAEARSLAMELQEATLAFDVGENFLAEIEPVLNGLKTLSADAGEESDAQLLLDDLKRRYTMVSQRQVHQQVMAGDSCGQHHELGDNVELF